MEESPNDANPSPPIDPRFSGVYIPNVTFGTYEVSSTANPSSVVGQIPSDSKPDAGAQSALGKAYYSGSGVDRDLSRALLWFGASAAQNNGYGQYMLGYMYENGEGVRPDIKTATEWYKKSAQNGYAAAKEWLVNHTQKSKK